ncbi:MAG: 3-oxoacyl-ACP reductase FabG [Chloroflexota bacterium]|nr:3-oxoacyl-ACP reductase FabG [Chloroflexota bacterium]
MKLAGRAALVTGAARGIGRAIALTLGREGADVAVADLDEAGVGETAEGIRALGRRALPLRMDVSQGAEVEAAVRRAEGEFGRVDVLVNNAGITRDAMLHRMTEEQFDQVIAVHLKGAWLCLRAVAPGMRERRWGKVVNISSISGKTGLVGQTNYSAAKAGIVGLTRAAALELARYNVNVNAIQPGFIETAMTQAIPEELRTQAIAAIPLGRTGKPEDIANAVLFLASEDSSFITGTVIEVTGGRGIG